MYYVKFCRAPSQLWVGSVVYKNGTYFASGHTLDNLVERVKKRLYAVDRVPFTSVMLESKQSLPSEMPIQYMTKIFRKRFWLPKDLTLEKPDEIIKNEKPKTIIAKQKRENTKETVMEQPKYEHYTYEEQDGKLIVYGFVKIAEYKLNNKKTKEENDGVQQ